MQPGRADYESRGSVELPGNDPVRCRGTRLAANPRASRANRGLYGAVQHTMVHVLGVDRHRRDSAAVHCLGNLRRAFEGEEVMSESAIYVLVILLYMALLVAVGGGVVGDIGGDNTDWYLAQDGNNNGYLMGTMDEVRIYSRALAEDEVQQNFESRGIAAVGAKDKLSIAWGMIKKEL